MVSLRIGPHPTNPTAIILVRCSLQYWLSGSTPYSCQSHHFEAPSKLGLERLGRTVGKTLDS